MYCALLCSTDVVAEGASRLVVLSPWRATSTPLGQSTPLQSAVRSQIIDSCAARVRGRGPPSTPPEPLRLHAREEQRKKRRRQSGWLAGAGRGWERGAVLLLRDTRCETILRTCRCASVFITVQSLEHAWRALYHPSEILRYCSNRPRMQLQPS